MHSVWYQYSKPIDRLFTILDCNANYNTHKDRKKGQLNTPADFLSYIIVMIILVSRPFYSRLYISNLKLCHEDSLTNGRGSRVAGRGSLVACRVLYVAGAKIRDFQLTPATYIRDPRRTTSQTFKTDILILLF